MSMHPRETPPINVLDMKNKHQESNSFDYEYDEKPEMFGHPYKELQDYLSRYAIKGTLLDLGCGQGRDSIFLARVGYQVTAVDSSKIGVRQMMDKAQSHGLKIDGIVSDAIDLKVGTRFDVILFDMLLHGFEKPKQIELLKTFSNYLNARGILCIVFPDDMDTGYFMNMLKSLPYDWKLLDEIPVKDVPKIEGEDNGLRFIMIVVQLISRK